jgi:small subunit ribosomal protein S9
MAELEYYYAIGRRKTSVATVRLFLKKGKSSVNGKNLSDIYPLKSEQAQFEEPFKVAELDTDGVSYTIVTKGGGFQSQLGAIKLGIARAIIKRFPEKKKALKDAGLLVRDSRMVERKKPGLRKARKAEQYSKR